MRLVSDCVACRYGSGPVFAPSYSGRSTASLLTEIVSLSGTDVELSIN